MSEWVGEWVGGWVSGWVGGWVKSQCCICMYCNLSRRHYVMIGSYAIFSMLANIVPILLLLRIFVHVQNHFEGAQYLLTVCRN